MGEIAADGRDVAHAHVRERAQGLGDHREGVAQALGAFERAERRERAEPQAAVGGKRNLIRPGDAAQRDQPGGMKHTGLHHQHERGAAGDRPHGFVGAVEQRNRLFERARLGQFEWDHRAASTARAAKAAESFSTKCRSISLALERITGWPRLPSLPVSAASISYCTRVDSFSCVSVVREVALSRPTMPCGVPSILASIVCGGSTFVTSTATSNLNLIYATLVSIT